MEWWQVVAYLVPVAAAMTWIRHREARQGVTAYEDLSPGQKAWVLLLTMPPGPAASLMGLFRGAEIEGYVQAGRGIRGSGQNLVPGVLNEFAGFLPAEWTRGIGRDADDLVGLLSRHLVSDSEEIHRVLLEHWPPPAPAPPAPARPEDPSPGEGEVVGQGASGSAPPQAATGEAPVGTSGD